MKAYNFVWVFVGENAKFPAALFNNLQDAEFWIEKNDATGILTKYPLDISIYDWCIENSYFKPKKEHEYSARFIQSFSSASQEHFHYENGNKV
jgi:hypothetical protein